MARDELSFPNRKTVLITGATRGIGWKFAKLFALAGFDLVITGRDTARLKSFVTRYVGAGVQIRIVTADLAEPGGVAGLLRQIAKQKIKVDILVNNAGFGDFGPVAHSDLGRLLGIIQVNIASLVQLTKELLPPMLAAGSGAILNVASTAAFAPGPLMATYYASKAFVWSFSSGLREELRGTGVTVSTLCPGPTRSDFDEAAGIGARRDQTRLMDAERVAAAGINGLLAGKRLIIPGLSNKITIFATRIVPGALLVRAVNRFNERKRK